MPPDSLNKARRRLLRTLQKQGIHDERVVSAINSIPRELFVPAELRERAYENTALPIGEGQTISQPYTVAFMLQLLDINPGQRILEVGGGSGYAAAVISSILESGATGSNATDYAGGRVYSVERIERLADGARHNLEACGCRRAEVLVGDGTKGLPQHAPFDRIIAAAEASRIPQSLVEQLTEDGLLLLPLHSAARNGAVMTRVKRSGGATSSDTHGLFRFVPLVDTND